MVAVEVVAVEAAETEEVAGQGAVVALEEVATEEVGQGAAVALEAAEMEETAGQGAVVALEAVATEEAGQGAAAPLEAAETAETAETEETEETEETAGQGAVVALATAAEAKVRLVLLIQRNNVQSCIRRFQTHILGCRVRNRCGSMSQLIHRRAGMGLRLHHTETSTLAFHWVSKGVAMEGEVLKVARRAALGALMLSGSLASAIPVVRPQEAVVVV